MCVASMAGGPPGAQAPAESAPHLVTEDAVVFPRPPRDCSARPRSAVWRGQHRWPPDEEAPAAAPAGPWQPRLSFDLTLFKEIDHFFGIKQEAVLYLKNTSVQNFRCH